MDLNRRRSTGGILKRSKDRSWGEEEVTRKDSKQLKSKMPDPKFHEKKELYNRRDQLVSITDPTRLKSKYLFIR